MNRIVHEYLLQTFWILWREQFVMKILNILKIAYRSLGRNKLRSFLTMLGIIIGVAAVIAMLAIGQGASNAVKVADCFAGNKHADRFSVRVKSKRSQNAGSHIYSAHRRRCTGDQQTMSSG